MYCTYCGEEIKPRLTLPGKCPRCKHDLDWRPAWVPNAILVVSILPLPILVGALHHFGAAWAMAGVVLGLALTVVLFNLLEIIAWRRGLLRSDKVSEEPVERREHIKKPLSELDYMTRAQVELARLDLPEVGGGIPAREPKAEPAPRPTPAADERPTEPAPPVRKRCRFEHIRAGQTQKIEYLSRLATDIVREHFDPIIGPAQNEYMISRFQTTEAIARQIADGYEYSFVCPPGTTGAEPVEERRIGFVAFRPRGAGELYLSKFYLRSDQRGRGYSHDMLEFVRREAIRLGCDRITLNVNRNNYQAILAYEHLGFRKVSEEKNDIGGGYYMDDFVYELDL